MDYSNISFLDLSEADIEKILQDYLFLKKMPEEKIENHTHFLNLENLVFQILKFSRESEKSHPFLDGESVFELLKKVIGTPIKNLNKNELSILLNLIESFGFEKIRNLDKLTKKDYIDTILTDTTLFFASSYHKKTIYEIFQERAPKNSEETLKAINKIENELERKINEEWGDESYTLGSCHRYWYIKKRILKEDYGITWYTPKEENPFVIYD